MSAPSPHSQNSRVWQRWIVISAVVLGLSIFVFPAVILWNVYGLAGQTLNEAGADPHWELKLQIANVLVKANFGLMIAMFGLLVVSILKYTRAGKQGQKQ